MIIRKAEIDDTTELISLLKIFYDEMGYEKQGYSYDPKSVRESLRRFMDMDTIYIVVIVDDNIIGVGGVMLVPSFMNFNDMKAIEFIWHVLPSIERYRRAKLFILLHKKMEEWVSQMGVKTFHLSVSPYGNNRAVGDYLERQGYTLRESQYSKEI